MRDFAVSTFGLKGPSTVDYTKSGMFNRFEHKGIDVGCDEMFQNGCSISYSKGGYTENGIDNKKWDKNSIDYIAVADPCSDDVINIPRSTLNVVMKYAAQLGKFEGPDFTEIAMGNRNLPDELKRDEGCFVMQFKKGSVVVNEEGNPVRVRLGHPIKKEITVGQS
jgi:hypothetical protein